MAEAALCFTLAPPESKLSTVPLSGGDKWGLGRIDKRYAEVQNSDNWFRFRNWAAVYSDTKSGCTWQCRLASHVVHTNSMFHMSLVWVDDMSLVWVDVPGRLTSLRVRSTLQF